jgi:hypothetical protein
MTLSSCDAYTAFYTTVIACLRNDLFVLITELRGTVTATNASYSEGLGVDSQPGGRLF